MSATATLDLEKTGTVGETAPRDIRPLNAKDRCDRCGAAAYVLAFRDDLPAELLFCGHHGKKFADELKRRGFGVADQTAKLYENTKPMSGSNMAD